MKRLILLILCISCFLPLTFSFAFPLSTWIPIGEEGKIVDINITSANAGCGSGHLVYVITLDTGLKFGILGPHLKYTPHVKIGDKIRIIQKDTGCWNHGTLRTIEKID